MKFLLLLIISLFSTAWTLNLYLEKQLRGMTGTLSSKLFNLMHEDVLIEMDPEEEKDQPLATNNSSDDDYLTRQEMMEKLRQSKSIINNMSNYDEYEEENLDKLLHEWVVVQNIHRETEDLNDKRDVSDSTDASSSAGDVHPSVNLSNSMKVDVSITAEDGSSSTTSSKCCRADPCHNAGGTNCDCSTCSEDQFQKEKETCLSPEYHCKDGKQNCGEDAIDCGGLCGGNCHLDVCPSCNDGIQNCGEVKVDCGGFCGECAAPPADADICPSCNDGIQNCGEEAPDCGGPCVPCVETKCPCIGSSSCTCEDAKLTPATELIYPDKNTVHENGAVTEFELASDGETKTSSENKEVSVGDLNGILEMMNDKIDSAMPEPVVSKETETSDDSDESEHEEDDSSSSSSSTFDPEAILNNIEKKRNRRRNEAKLGVIHSPVTGHQQIIDMKEKEEK